MFTGEEKFVSRCCGEDVRMEGFDSSGDRLLTCYHICTHCGKACDLLSEEKISEDKVDQDETIR